MTLTALYLGDMGICYTQSMPFKVRCSGLRVWGLNCRLPVAETCPNTSSQIVIVIIEVIATIALMVVIVTTGMRMKVKV